MPSVLVARVLALVVFGSYACTCEWLVGRFLPVHWVHIVVHAWRGVTPVWGCQMDLILCVPQVAPP
jgi:hypothetical protein